MKTEVPMNNVSFWYLVNSNCYHFYCVFISTFLTCFFWVSCALLLNDLAMDHWLSSLLFFYAFFYLILIDFFVELFSLIASTMRVGPRMFVSSFTIYIMNTQMLHYLSWEQALEQTFWYVCWKCCNFNLDFALAF